MEWFASFAKPLVQQLSDTGSMIVELGSAWEKSRPEMTTVPLISLLGFMDAGNLHLCQQFIWSIPLKLPTPAQWVNIGRVRVKDSFTHIWFGKIPNVKAYYRNVFREFNQSMKRLLRNGRSNSGWRSYERAIGDKPFVSNSGGSIPPSVLEMANTNSSARYLAF